jgi:hypothetical protein
MKRQTLLNWLGAALALSCLGSANGLSSSNVAAAGLPAARTEAPATAAPPYYFSFEDGIAPWKPGTDTRESIALVWGKGRDGCLDSGYHFANLQSFSGGGSGPKQARIPQPVGTWMMINLPALKGPSAIQLDWAASNVAKNCTGCILAAYAGTSPAASAGQFRQVGLLAAEGWKNYHADFKLLGNAKDSLYVAIGWLGFDASVAVDCVTIRITNAKSDN